MFIFVWSPYFYLKESQEFWNLFVMGQSKRALKYQNSLLWANQRGPKVSKFFVMGQSKRPFGKKEGLVLYNGRNGI